MQIAEILRWRPRIIALALVTILAGLAYGQSNDNAVTIRILVLDGHNGKPVRGHEVQVLSSRDLLAKGHTNDDGILSVTRKLPDSIIVIVAGRPLCVDKNKAAEPTSLLNVQDILSRGVVEANSCSSQVRHSALPGTLVLFVRRENVSEVLDVQ